MVTWHFIIILILTLFIVYRVIRLTINKVASENENAKMKTAMIILNIFYILLILSVYGGIYWW